ncbi:MAG TPA: hypothetical protein VGN14_11100 [Candidatus Elarobacter sp.]|jgi:hypothetical protein
MPTELLERPLVTLGGYIPPGRPEPAEDAPEQPEEEEEEEKE